MDQGVIAQKLINNLKNISPENLEAALVQDVLSKSSIKKVINKKINRISLLDNWDVIKAKDWLAKEKVETDLSLLEKFYELQATEEDRKMDGGYYTPNHIVKYIVDETIVTKGTVCDPACGSGAFLVESAKKLKKYTNKPYYEIYKHNLFGVDIVSVNVERTKIVLSLLAILEKEDIEDYVFNIYHGDSLTISWNDKVKSFSGFDFVVGNPPYVRTKNLRTDVKEAIKNWYTGSIGNVDLYIPFFELAVSITNKKARIGFITPSTYFSSVNARNLRKYLSEKSLVEKIVDFNGWQIFKGATTYTCITLLNKAGVGNINFTLVDKLELVDKLDKLSFSSISSAELTGEEWRLLRKEDAENIFKIENVGSPLYKYVDRFITGIATLQNDLFLVEDDGLKSKYLFKDYKGKTYKIERDITKKIIKPNTVKDIEALLRNRERIIYPYKLNEKRAVIIPEIELQKKFPKAYEYLQVIRKDLALRDKGGKTYATWYAYGRTQGLDGFGEKIILPMMNNKPSFIIVNEKDTLFYCGYAIYPKKKKDFQLLEKILNSDIMWLYLSKTSKNYSGGFKSFAKNYVKNFSIPEFTPREKSKLLLMKNSNEINTFLWKKYDLI